ncbi:glycosyltransferase family protein [Enemella sp. A6]|uniref:glycosyltransferase family protein n=1 Tax=Enemella sp. A6 TaxID=3440152 RepID=UPI003EBEC834
MELNRLGGLAKLPFSSHGRRRLVSGVRNRGKKTLTKVRKRFVRTRVALPGVGLPHGPIARPELRVAVILDDFSRLGFHYEWDQVLITPDGWRAELEAELPDLLFVESAWRGNQGAWQFALTGQNAPAPALIELVTWCREHGVPTVFWNKEDPPNYDRFIATARLFEHVFTVDANRIERYRHDLGHDRIHLLPFWAQPRIHNPIRHGAKAPERPYEVAFAGSYFAEKHAERRRQLDVLLPAAADHGLHIFSRMQAEDPRYRFPQRYVPYIVGSLPYEEMLAAYTSYKVFLNVNSVTESPTMCARRLFELSAAQTAVLSGPAASIEPFFGDDITVVDTPEQAKEALHNLLAHHELRDRQALRAHRRVHDRHLTTHRVDTVLGAVGLPTHRPDESVSAVIPTMRPDQLANVWQFLHRQSHPEVQLVLVTHGFEPGRDQLDELQGRWPLDNVEVLPADSALLLGDLMNMGVEASSGRFVAKMDDDNYYAEHYLGDLVRAFRWTDAQVVGKWAHYVHIGDDFGPTLLRFADSEHRYVRLVQGGTILTPREVAEEVRFEQVPRRVDTTFLDKIHARGGRVYSSDRFNFISTRTSDATGHTWGVSTAHLLSHSSILEFYGPAEAHVTC